MVRLGLIRLIVVVLCILLVKANDVPDATLEGVEVTVDGSIETTISDIVGAESKSTRSLEQDEEAAALMRSMAKQLEDKEAALLTAKTEIVRMAAERAKLHTAFEQTKTELDRVKSIPAPEPVTITEKDPATEAALLKATDELNAVKRELKEVEAAAAAAAAASSAAAAAVASAIPDTSVTDKLSEALSTCRIESEAVTAELQSQTVRLVELENETAALKASSKPTLSNRKDDSTGKSAGDGDDGEDSLSLEGFMIFLRGKYDTFMADVYASPVLAQVTATLQPMYLDAPHYVVDVIVPYCRDDLMPLMQTFYVTRFVPFVADTSKLLARSYAIARPQVIQAIESGRAFVTDVAMPAYRQHVVPPLVELYQANVAPTVNNVIIPWYTANITPHVKTATTATDSFYKTHLRRHVQPTLELVWRKLNYVSYKVLNFLDAENLYDQVVLLAQDAYNLTQLAHDTFTSYLRTHPVIRKMCGKNLESAITVLEYASALLVVLVLRKLIVFLVRVVLLVLLFPLLAVYWVWSGIRRVIFGKRNLRAPKKAASQTKYASTGTAHAAPSPQGRSSSHSSGARYEPDGDSASAGSSHPPSAVSKPSRPPRSSTPHAGSAAAFVGSPVPQHSNSHSNDHDM